MGRGRDGLGSVGIETVVDENIGGMTVEYRNVASIWYNSVRWVLGDTCL